MRRVRFSGLVVLATVALAGCGGGSHVTATSTVRTSTAGSGRVPSFSSARAASTAARTVEFTLKIRAHIGAATVESEETGLFSFRERRAHLYKQIPGSPVPQELVLLGPFTYTNGNVQAALSDPTVKPWTKLDTRRLAAKQRRNQPDELAHVVAPAYLSDGVARATPAGRAPDGETRFTGLVDPSLLARNVPAAARASVLAAVRNDYQTKPFPATFWLDGRGRVRRVRVDYRTAQRTRITVDTSYSGFGSKINVTLPAAGDIEDISP